MKPHDWSWFNRIFFALFAFALIGVIVFLAWRSAGASEERLALISALQQSQEQLRDEGIEPEAPDAEKIVAGSPGATGARGPEGPRGPQGLMGLPGQIGPQGEPGEDGAAGAPGSAGASGADGQSVTGPAGPQGPQGVTGPQGERGSDGRGVTSVDCQEDGSWLITYTDTTTSTTPGPCRIVIIPEEGTP